VIGKTNKFGKIKEMRAVYTTLACLARKGLVVVLNTCTTYLMFSLAVSAKSFIPIWIIPLCITPS
jgi:hypothetical protein